MTLLCPAEKWNICFLRSTKSKKKNNSWLDGEFEGLFKKSYYVLGIKTLRLFDEFSISK